jgi:hypothetical protein
METGVQSLNDSQRGTKMTNDEKLDAIYQSQLRMEPLVEHHERVLNGNGQPGLLDRMKEQEVLHTSCPARAAAQADVKTGKVSNWIAIGAVILSAIGLVLAVHLSGGD